MRVCLSCNFTKSLKEFYRKPSGKYGRHSRCKVCMKKEQLARNAYKPPVVKRYKDYLKENNMYEYYKKSKKYQI